MWALMVLKGLQEAKTWFLKYSIAKNGISEAGENGKVFQSEGPPGFAQILFQE